MIVFIHFADTYTAQASVSEVHRAIANHKVSLFCESPVVILTISLESRVQRCCTPRVWQWRRWRWSTSRDVRECVCSVGLVTSMLTKDQLRRIRAATNHHRELPPVSMGSTVEEFFEGIERDTKEGCTLPVWYVIRFSCLSMFECWWPAGVENYILRCVHVEDLAVHL